MAEEGKDIKVTKEKSITADDKGKSPEVEVKKETVVAPESDKPTDKPMAETEVPEAEDIDAVLELLNYADTELGGKGGITAIPEELKNSIRFLTDKFEFIRTLWEDPKWEALLDDLVDQKEDGKTPSIDVAIARTIPLAKLQELADSEDYEGAQGEVANTLDSQKQMADEEAMYDANFQESQKAGEEYAAEMGYDEAEKAELFQMVLDLFKIMADGKLTKDEFAKVDKMRTFDKVTGDLTSQIAENTDAKEVLPDQASVEATITGANAAPKKPSRPSMSGSNPGMGSLGALDNVATDITKVGSRKRFGK